MFQAAEKTCGFTFLHVRESRFGPEQNDREQPTVLGE
jgi:hypothetical protein